jgi:hypothetical protein
LTYEAPYYAVFPISRHFISLLSKYSPHHPGVKHSLLVCFSLNARE